MPEVTSTADALSSDFRRIFEAEFGYVTRSLRRLGVEEADISDISQELFVAVNERLGGYDPTRPVRPWLFSFALRFAANYRRLSRNRASIVEFDEANPQSSDPNIEARDLVLRALSELDFDRRTVLVMHDLEGFPAPEISEQRDAPLNTVYSRLRLAREDFRSAVTRLQSKGELL